jgi:microcompartment protein CcmL/EutN
MMKKYPAIALLELSSIARGILCADTMIKRAPMTVIKSGTVHNGKYIILFGGSVASVEEAFIEGRSIAGEDIIDHVFLPDVHQQVHDAVLGLRSFCSKESIGIFETSTIAATIQSADAAIKGADIEIVEIRLADHLGGKAFAIVTGQVEDVQTAVKIAFDNTTHQKYWVRKTVIPHLHSDMASQIDQSTYFGQLDVRELQEGEI